MLNEGIAELKRTDKSVKTVVAEIAEQRDHIPGMGHPILEPEDPRTDRLFELVEEEGYDGDYVILLKIINAVVQEDHDEPVPINAAGALGPSSGRWSCHRSLAGHRPDRPDRWTDRSS